MVDGDVLVHGFLSFAGRISLIKSVIIYLPLYYLSLFKASTAITKEIKKAQRNFYGGGDVKVEG